MDCVAIGIGNDVSVLGVIDSDDYEALAGDGGGKDIIIEARDAVARGEEQDGAVI